MIEKIEKKIEINLERCPFCGFATGAGAYTQVETVIDNNELKDRDVYCFIKCACGAQSRICKSLLDAKNNWDNVSRKFYGLIDEAPKFENDILKLESMVDGLSDASRLLFDEISNVSQSIDFLRKELRGKVG